MSASTALEASLASMMRAVMVFWPMSLNARKRRSPAMSS